ncbi:hypothetical protein NEA10_18060 [Phormidium yuhuli AB48]|uniref:Uncharacterized protein n=1 Tax=Phormidium yuhuli AB48 TaxID=2940671 RepID=A0ABY5ANB3_9CYAN|nr:hypothetical protein [Phormidium yuhuli]USR90702.1 hypothetical protein NEA10_18060 [Phormidium yuhuli AB48]
MTAYSESDRQTGEFRGYEPVHLYDWSWMKPPWPLSPKPNPRPHFHSGGDRL